MSYGFPSELLKRLGAQAVIAANRRVARRFVPAYASAAAIRVAPIAPYRALTRRELARMIDPRRLSS
jgi:hypothetical protein